MQEIKTPPATLSHPLLEGLNLQDVGLKDFEYVVISDGSGHAADKCGGCCAVVFDQDRWAHTVMSVQSQTTVSRMELKGLLEGLTLISQLPDFFSGSRVLWLCDNLSSVEMVNEQAVAKNNLDLWTLFDYFSQSMQITAMHIDRSNDNYWHGQCDLHASTLRLILIDYIKHNSTFPKHAK